MARRSSLCRFYDGGLLEGEVSLVTERGAPSAISHFGLRLQSWKKCSMQVLCMLWMLSKPDLSEFHNFYLGIPVSSQLCLGMSSV